MKDHCTNPIVDTVADAKEYAMLTFDRFKLKLLESLSTTMSSILGIAIFMVLCSFALLFVMVGLTWLLAEWMNSPLGAIFIMAAVFAIAALVVFLCRKKIMVNQMVRTFAKMLFENDKDQTEDFYE